MVLVLPAGGIVTFPEIELWDSESRNFHGELWVRVYVCGSTGVLSIVSVRVYLIGVFLGACSSQLS